MAITRTFSTGISGDNYTPTYIDEFDMVGKVALSVLKDINTKNPLALFEQYKIDNGDTIEKGITKLIESRAYDSTGSRALTPNRTPKFEVQYFKGWEREVYETTIDKSELRKTLLSTGSVTEVANKIVSALSRSDTRDKFNYTKGLFTYGATNNVFVQQGTTIDLSQTNGYKTLLKRMKDTIKGMTFVSNSFNSAQEENSSLLEDIYIVMPYTLKNAIDVDELSGIFNLEKAELSKRIIETDATDNNVYIVDKNAVIIGTRLFEMENQKNADALTWNYFLHVERTYCLCNLFNACYISYTFGE